MANIAPTDLCRKAALDKLVYRHCCHENWPVHAEVFQLPVKWLVSRRPIWTPIDISAQWGEAWESASVVNQGLVPDPTIRQPGFDVPHQSWSLLNRFQTGQRQCHADLFKWGLSTFDLCKCGQLQMKTHIVNSCPESSLDDGLPRLHSADDYALLSYLAEFGDERSNREMKMKNLQI